MWTVAGRGGGEVAEFWRQIQLRRIQSEGNPRNTIKGKSSTPPDKPPLSLTRGLTPPLFTALRRSCCTKLRTASLLTPSLRRKLNCWFEYGFGGIKLCIINCVGCELIFSERNCYLCFFAGALCKSRLFWGSSSRFSLFLSKCLNIWEKIWKYWFLLISMLNFAFISRLQHRSCNFLFNSIYASQICFVNHLHLLVDIITFVVDMNYISRWHKYYEKYCWHELYVKHCCWYA